MIIKVSRKELNEKDDYIVSIDENDDREAVSPSDDMVIELLYEMLNNKD